MWNFLSLLILLQYLGTLCVFRLGFYYGSRICFCLWNWLIAHLKWRMKLAGGSPVAQCMLSMHEPPGFNPQHQKQRKRRMKTFVYPIHYTLSDTDYVGKKVLYGRFRVKNIKCYENKNISLRLYPFILVKIITGGIFCKIVC